MLAIRNTKSWKVGNLLSLRVLRVAYSYYISVKFRRLAVTWNLTVTSVTTVTCMVRVHCRRQCASTRCSQRTRVCASSWITCCRSAASSTLSTNSCTSDCRRVASWPPSWRTTPRRHTTNGEIFQVFGELIRAILKWGARVCIASIFYIVTKSL